MKWSFSARWGTLWGQFYRSGLRCCHVEGAASGAPAVTIDNASNATVGRGAVFSARTRAILFSGAR